MASSALPPEAWISTWLSSLPDPSPPDWPNLPVRRLISPSPTVSAATNGSSSESAGDLPVGHVPAVPASAWPTTFSVGSGAAIFRRVLLPALLQARREVVLVTCFWSRDSETRLALSAALEMLAAARMTASREHGQLPTLRVRIGLSSLSLWQKLVHPSSREGRVFSPAEWTAVLGLPDVSVLQTAGIELSVKSLFFRPLSVLHPKFLIVDRERAWLPSCNVSWEDWLEGCIGVQGEGILGALMDFYWAVWETRSPMAPLEDVPEINEEAYGWPINTSSLTDSARPLLAYIEFSPTPSQERVHTVLLPSPHHTQPNFRPLPCQSTPIPSPTPLNLALRQLFGNARTEIFLQTPNITCPAVVDAIVAALARGVNVSLVTSRGAMVLEQLVTAGQTNAQAVAKLVARYRTLAQGIRLASSAPTRSTGGGPGNTAALGLGKQLNRSGNAVTRLYSGLLRTKGRADDATYRPILSRAGAGADGDVDVEAQIPTPGRLQIRYFPSAATRPGRMSRRASRAAIDVAEPERRDHGLAHTHLKLTIVDGMYVVLGSGNMDRASWFTSQELGILFCSENVAGRIRATMEEVLSGRTDLGFDVDVD